MIKKTLSFSKLFALSFFSLVAFHASAQHSKQKIDGVLGVVGDLVILESDIDKKYLELSVQNIPIKDVSRCELLDQLLREKIFAHQAVQDSIIVSDSEITGLTNNQLDEMSRNAGSMDEIIKFYKKKDLEDLRQSLFEIIKEGKLASEMTNKIIDEVDITPEEVRQFFVSIPKDSLPNFGSEIEISQIVFKPKISDDAKESVIKSLKEIKKDVLEGGSFFSKAVLYSEDPGSKNNGGFYLMNRKTPFVKEFKEVAFSLKEGEISEPFESEFGFHIIYLEKIKGQDLELRHILMSPKVSMSAELEAKERAEMVRKKITDGELTFAEAAKLHSDDKETKNSGGSLINPRSLETRFELTKLDPALYAKVSYLDVNEISYPSSEVDQSGKKLFKLFTITNKIPDHTADFATDYIKIKNLALNNKQTKAIDKWLKETIEKTYISVNTENKNCDFKYNWLKK